MSKFKVGDKVRLVDGPYGNVLVDHVGEVVRVKPSSFPGVDLLTVTGIDADAFSDRFELVEEAKPVQPEPQVPGIPEGYRLVRVGKVNTGDFLVDNGIARMWEEPFTSMGTYAIVEPINPPEPVKPKTMMIRLHEVVFFDNPAAAYHDIVNDSVLKDLQSLWNTVHVTNTREIEVPLE